MALLKHKVLFFALFKYKADDFIVLEINCQIKNNDQSEGWVRQHFVLY